MSGAAGARRRTADERGAGQRRRAVAGGGGIAGALPELRGEDAVRGPRPLCAKVPRLRARFFQLQCRGRASGLPDPELMIRTSGEYRISNFLLYQLAYAELYFTQVRWPDFRKQHLYEAIIDFQGRERRFGKTGEQVGELSH